MNDKILAFPHTYDSGIGTITQFGLTKREYFAGLAMQGVCANRWSMETGYYSIEELAEKAVQQADALLKSLEK